MIRLSYKVYQVPYVGGTGETIIARFIAVFWWTIWPRFRSQNKDRVQV